MIPLQAPFLSGKEKEYVNQVLDSGNLSGNGIFTKKCHDFFEKKFGFPKVLLTNSCTDALEMCTLLLDLKPGDEVLLPSYTFVSTANAFFNYGVTPVFCDSLPHNPNIDPQSIALKITPKTKAIVVMHYAGISCDMSAILALAKKHNLYVIEDAALGLGSFYHDQPLGSFGDVAAFSFHQTKNITCGEGGLLVVNNPKLAAGAEIIWEKGTNRAAFLRGESDKYEWVSKGSSFLTSEIHAAFLLGQLENYDLIQEKRTKKWNYYLEKLNGHPALEMPLLPEGAAVNGSLFYFLFKNPSLTAPFIDFMKKNGISVSTHYRCLHTSALYRSHYAHENLIHCEKIAASLVRLPLFTGLTPEEQNMIIDQTNLFLNNI